jgi:putative ABC transport system permease protein
VVSDRLQITFKISDRPHDVVGVLDEPQYTSRNRKALATSPKYLNLYVPAETALRQFGTTYMIYQEGSRSGVKVEVDQIIVGAETTGDVLRVAATMRQILEKNHPRRDYEMVVPLELLQQEEKAQRVFGITMILIASISLVVGGIGIINIMLATVTERTREIGIRRACGAKRTHIAYQFLIETTTLSLIGGMIGALVGIAGVNVVAPRIGWTAIITPESLLLALGISCIVGVLFGTYPAFKAARMDPIEALRFE